MLPLSFKLIISNYKGQIRPDSIASSQTYTDIISHAHAHLFVQYTFLIHILHASTIQDIKTRDD